MKCAIWLLLGLIGTLPLYAQSDFERDQVEIAAWLDTLETRHDEAAFRGYANSTFRQKQKEYSGDNYQMFFELLLKQGLKKYSDEHRIIALIYHQYGTAAYKEDDLDLSEVHLEKSLSLRQQLLPTLHPETANTWYMLGRTQYWLDKNNEAIYSFKQSKNRYSEIGNTFMVIQSLLFIGDTYDYLDEKELAKTYYEYAIIEAEKEWSREDYRLAKVYLDAGGVNADNHEIALNYYRQAIAIYEAGGHTQRSNYTSAKINYAQELIDLERLQEALEVLLPIAEQKESKKDQYELDIVYESLGAIYRRRGDFSRALDYYQRGMALRREGFDEFSEEMNYVYHNLGEVFKDMQDFPQAAAYYQRAMRAAKPSFTVEDWSANPQVDTLPVNTTIADLIKDLDFKGNLFLDWYRKSGDVEQLKIALATFERAADFIYDKRSELIADGSKLIWQDQLFPVVEHYLEVLYTAAAVEGFAGVDAQIFQLMERSKALVLMESLLQQQQAFDFPGRDTLEEAIASQQQFFAERQREILEKGETPDRKLALLKAKIAWLETQSVLQRSQSELNQKATVESLMAFEELPNSLLGPKQGLVQYFVGDSTVYVLLLTQKAAYRHRFPLNELGADVNSFRLILNQPDGSWEDFAEQGYTLYSRLLEPVFSQLEEWVEELIVVPDGPLTALPFEVLLLEKGTPEQHFGSGETPYLLRALRLSYAFSVSTWQQQLSGRSVHGRYAFLGFAPDFNTQAGSSEARTCERTTLSPLLENGREVEAIQSIVGGQARAGAYASKSYFLEQADQARILHLATHACVDDSEPARSRIFFADDHLYVHELYDLPLNAEMVVLSACETGVGTFRRGEGVMSLARGFAASGAPSLTLSYWSVSDKSTAEIMAYYYGHLAEGKAKHDALRDAKLDYLSTQEQSRFLHPYYWAAFVHFGDYTPVSITKQAGIPRWSYFLLVPVLLLIIYLSYRKLA